ncbi:MAG: DUF86 domain-containing protein [Bacteroidetes bacterium]|jgi:uncharacterized protein with HEPN domain|nr:DUF86 domain-containing protein [Bacteroidota bacterium]
MNDARLYLQHILDCLKRIRTYTGGKEAYFLNDEKTQDAVLRNLQTLAESTQRLPEELKQQHSDIDWRGIAGFRNVVVHNYLGVDLEQIWAIIKHDLPLLEAAVREMLEALR